MSRSSLAHGPELQPASLPAPPVPGGRWQAHVYAHTHWDREWYRTFERFRMQLVGVVDRLLTVLDSDPSFTTFVLDGQSIVLEDYLAIRPEEEPRLRRLVGAGRIEVGPWYVLPDEFLVSGESLVRNLLEGRRVAARFGEPLDVGYLPDPFGHVAQLPAILRGFGIDNVLFSRGMGDEFEHTGSEFRWESPSGVDVLAIVQLSTYTSGYCNAELLARGHGADDREPYVLACDLARHVADTAGTELMLLAAGCDHETVQEELPVIVERLQGLLPDADVRISGLAAAVRTARDGERRREQAGSPLPRYRGELRGSLQAPILASIFSARVPLKQQNDALQVLLERHVEPLMATAVLAGVRPARDVEPFLRHAWRLALQNHPHDSIGGCSIDEVHEEMHARSLRAKAVCGGLIEDLRIATGLGRVAVVHDPEGRGGIAERADGTPVAVAAATPGRLHALEPLVLEAGAEVVDAGCVRAGALEARVVQDGDGARLEVATVAGSSDAAIALDWIDDGDAGDEYDFGVVGAGERIAARLERWSTSVAGPGVAQLEVVHAIDLPERLAADRASRASTARRHEIVTRVRLSEASSLAQLVVELDNRAEDHRLRLRATPVGGAKEPARVEALGHFAVVERTLRRAATAKRPWKQPPLPLDHCSGAVRLVPEAGDPLLVAGRGMHEYEVVEVGDGHALELTVLRCVGWLSRSDVPARPGHAGPALPTPGAQCPGRHRVELAAGIGDGATFAAARAFLAPPLVLEPFGIGEAQEVAGTRAADGTPLESGAIARARDVLAATPPDARERIEALGLVVGADGAVPSACRLADDGSGDLVVRWWAPSSADSPRGWLELRAPVASVQRARLDERPLGPAPFADGRCEVAVPPGGIVTVRVRLSA